MRFLRRAAAGLLVPVLLVVATVVGTLTAVLVLPMGRPLLARLVTQWISGRVAGTVAIGGVHGDLWNQVDLDDLVIRDTANQVVLSTPHLEAQYLLPGLLAGRLVFHDVRADSLVLHLVRLRRGQWNYEAVFHLGEGPGDGKPPPLLSFSNVTLNAANVRIDIPTDDQRGANPKVPRRKPVSRNGRLPAQPRIERNAEGWVHVYTATGLDTRLRLLRISTPRRDPILAQVTTLRMALNDPQLTITQFAGQILTAGDTLRFRLDSAGMPGTRLRGAGALRWPQGDLLFDFTLEGQQVALRDLWWIQPDFPDWHGRFRVTAHSLNRSHTDFALDNVVLGDSVAQAGGRLTVMIDDAHDLGFRGLDLALRSVPIDLLRPYLDTLPVSGRLTGHLVMDGYLDSLRMQTDVAFADALVSGAPVSRLPIDGVIRFGGDPGAVFQAVRLDNAAVALATVRRQVPSVLIPGTLRLDGRLDGPWKDATFVGTAEHDAPNGAVSRMIGAVRLDTRADVLGVGLDADFDQLSFDALRTGYPDLTARGGLTGHVVANGTLDSLDLDGNVTGDIGTVHAAGRVRVNTPHLGADNLVLDVQRFDASAVLASGTSTALNGRVTVSGTFDSGVPPRGRLDIALDRSRFGGATVDEVSGVVRADRGLLSIDTGAVLWPNGRVDAHGTLGWAAPDSGVLVVSAAASSLAPFDSLIRAATGLARDTLHPHPFDGVAQAALVVTGSRELARISGTVTGRNLVLDNWHADGVQAQFHEDSIEATVESAGSGVHVADTLHVNVAGRRDSLTFRAHVRMLGLAGDAAGGWVAPDSTRSELQLDALALDLPHQHWRLGQPTRLSFAEGGIAFGDSVALNTVDGSGVIRLAGRLPGDTPGALGVHVAGLDLYDVATVLDRDTTAFSGNGSLDLQMTGTRDAPAIRGATEVTGLITAGVHVPLVDATIDYAARRLHSDVSLWQTGQRVFDLDLSLPYDLALASRADRKVPGNLAITGKADSVDLVILAALIPAIHNPTGSLRLDVRGSGTWDAPHLEGSVVVQHGAMGLPALNVSYTDIQGSAHFVNDAMVIDSLRIRGDEGSLTINGTARFPQFTKPTLDLQLHPRTFLAIDAPNYLTLRATGNLTLSGSLWQPVLRSADDVTVSQSVLYFADLISKNVIDLEAEENIGLVDTVALMRHGLGNEFSSRFLDSLRVDNVRIRLGNEVWLRSDEANVQLEGQLTVDKTHKQYLLSGNLNAPRGSYTLRIGAFPATDFTVESGSVLYSGTPDLNADLDLKARHDVRTADGDDIPVVAEITGTTRVPKVTLTSPGRDLTQRDILSYMLFGRSEFQVAGAESASGGGYVAQSALTFAASALSGEISRSVLNNTTGNGLYMFEVRPGLSSGGLVAGSPLTQLAAGVQFGRRWFVSFDAGFCLGGQTSNFQSRNLGASLEYRFTREWRFQADAEPVQSCITNRATDVFTTLNRYQLGGNFLWLRDY